MDTNTGSKGTRPPPAVRQAALLFLFSGVLGMVTSFIPGSLGYGLNSLRLIDAAAIAVAAVVFFVLPWDRWPLRASLVLVPIALVLIALSERSGGVPAPIYGVWFMMTFAWVGMWHPARTSLWCTPVAVAAYLVPFVGRSTPTGYAGSVFIAIPAAVVLGEVMSRTCDAMRRAQGAQRDAMALLAKANLTDDLTGLGNRRRGNALLDDLAPDDALLMLDLDLFKHVNDTYGHAAGDALLADLGRFLEDEVRGSDEVARFGGEEFIVTLRSAGLAGAEKAELLRTRWEQRGQMTTFSVGVAVHQAGQSPSVTFAAADRALYAAKMAGRNRVLAAWECDNGVAVPAAKDPRVS